MYTKAVTWDAHACMAKVATVYYNDMLNTVAIGSYKQTPFHDLVTDACTIILLVLFCKLHMLLWEGARISIAHFSYL